MNEADKHSRHSVLREVILEHALIADILRDLWSRDVFDAEILRSEFDAGGFDLVMTRGNVTRHVQLKSRLAGKPLTTVTVGLKLEARRSGCVVCLIVNDDLTVAHFRWLGGGPETSLSSISALPIARNTRSNSQGHKQLRPDHRVVPLRSFERIDGVAALVDRLLGQDQADGAAGKI